MKKQIIVSLLLFAGIQSMQAEQFRSPYHVVARKNQVVQYAKVISALVKNKKMSVEDAFNHLLKAEVKKDMGALSVDKNDMELKAEVIALAKKMMQ